MNNNLSNEARYCFEFANNHPVIEIDGGYYVIDTGSPVSFSIDGSTKELIIDGERFELVDISKNINRNAMEALVGRSLNGLIGMNILTRMNSLYLNKATGFASFGNGGNYQFANEIEIENKSARDLGFLTATIGINGNSVPSILDSGACIGYISGSLAEGCEAIGTIHDYNPFFGNIETASINVNLSVCNNEFPSRLAVMTPEIEKRLFGYKAVIGFGEIQWEELLLDIAGGKLCYK